MGIILRNTTWKRFAFMVLTAYRQVVKDFLMFGNEGSGINLI